MKIAVDEKKLNEIGNLRTLVEVADAATAWHAVKVLEACGNELQTHATTLSENNYELPLEQKILYTQKMSMQWQGSGQLAKWAEAVVLHDEPDDVGEEDATAWDIAGPKFSDLPAPKARCTSLLVRSVGVCFGRAQVVLQTVTMIHSGPGTLCFIRLLHFAVA